jgi:CRP/FNR family cyclic AMP-dependent transcriptional regulator
MPQRRAAKLKSCNLARIAQFGNFMVTIDLFHNAENTQRFAAGQKIFGEGEAGDMMYVVVEGRVDLLVHGKLVEELGPGGVLGEMALIDTGTRSATAIAKTDCKLASINEKRFKFLVQQTPNFALQLMRIIADRLRRMDSRL